MEANVSHLTALYAFDCMRYAILESSYVMDRKIRGKFELDETYFGGKLKGNRGRGAKNKIIVFGILERKGSVQVEIVKNVKARTLLNKMIKKVKKGRCSFFIDKSTPGEGIYNTWSVLSLEFHSRYWHIKSSKYMKYHMSIYVKRISGTDTPNISNVV